MEPYLEEGPKERRPDRAQLLSQWASFAVYLPEKTLELAKLALQSVEAPLVPADSTSASQTEATLFRMRLAARAPETDCHLASSICSPSPGHPLVAGRRRAKRQLAERFQRNRRNCRCREFRIPEASSLLRSR